MTLKRFISALLTLLTGFTAFAQSIEFVENKGQWDRSVLYAGKVPAGYFFIHKTGFTVLQHNDADLQRLQAAMHHHSDSAQHKKGKVTEEKDLILRSHAYRVQFSGAGEAALPWLISRSPPLRTTLSEKIHRSGALVAGYFKASRCVMFILALIYVTMLKEVR